MSKLRVTLDREELVTILWTLEAIIEDYKHDGGTILAEDEIALHNKLDKRLRDHDLRRRHTPPVSAADGTTT